MAVWVGQGGIHNENVSSADLKYRECLGRLLEDQ